MDVLAIMGRVDARLAAWDVPRLDVAGWQTRGRPYAFEPQCVRCHHTATKSYANEYASVGIVRDGRSDLPGPLAQYGLGRHQGTVLRIASGYANDGGGGGWDGLRGNGSGWGIEAENDGVGEVWGPNIRRSYLLLVAALCIETPIGPHRVCEHYEWSDGGKVDRANYERDSDLFRADVAAVIDSGLPGMPGTLDWWAAHVPILTS